MKRYIVPKGTIKIIEIGPDGKPIGPSEPTKKPQNARKTSKRRPK